MEKSQQIIAKLAPLQTYKVGLVILVLFTSFWMLKNLDICMLWQDEAETVCVAQTVLTDGIPKGTDGRNFFSQQEGREYGENYEWKLHPWFQFYWLALFFSIFEPSTFWARFPFTLLGIGTVLLSFFLARRVWKDDKTASLVALAFLLNVFFLLLSRQARYYAPVMFFSVYGTWALLDILEQKKWATVHYVVATILFFQSQYLFAINFWIATLIYTYLFYKDKIKQVGIAVVIAALPSIPFLIWILDTPYGETLTQGATEEGVKHGFVQFGGGFFNYILEPIWLLILVPMYFFKDNFKDITKESEQILVFFLLIIIGNIVAIALVVPEYYIRYLCATIPFALLLKARIGSWLFRLHLAVPIALLVGVAMYKGHVASYIQELGNDSFTGTVEAMVNFVKREAEPTDRIAISFEDLPLKFYLKNKIYGGLAGDLPPSLDSMDVIIIRMNAISSMDKKVQERLDKYMQKNHHKFKAYALNTEDAPFQNRETPDEHYYIAPLVTNPLTIHVRK